MHPFAKDKRFYGGHGIVGSSLPIAAGIAFANRYRDNRAVCVGYMGDGASYQGQVAEAFNLAAAWALPVVFVIENNDVSSYTHIQANTSRECLAQRGAPFGIPGCQVDGMDVEAVVQAMQVVRRMPASGMGPTSWKCRPAVTAGTLCPIPTSMRPRPSRTRSRASRPIRCSSPARPERGRPRRTN